MGPARPPNLGADGVLEDAELEGAALEDAALEGAGVVEEVDIFL